MAEQRGRRPEIFRLEDAGLTLAPAETLPDVAEPALAPVAPQKRRRLISLGGLFWTALGGLVSLGTGLAVTRLIEDLFARADWLGAVGLGFAALFAIAILGLIGREMLGLARLSSLDSLRERAADAMARDDRPEAERVARDLIALSKENPRLARARGDLSTHLGAIIDGADLVRLTERTLMAPLDAQARALVSDAAKRVSVVTAVSPRAAIDLFFVLYTAATLMRRLADLYGGRPGVFGMIRLGRHVLSHLAVTGGMAAGDSLVQQILGHGLAAKLSARLGEGVVNGLLTARLGLAAIAVTRPLPFAALPPPRLADVATGLIRKAEADNAPTKP
ncbi:YcjF family protein [Xanthobacteraceae bacterium A53D]